MSTPPGDPESVAPETLIPPTPPSPRSPRGALPRRPPRVAPRGPAPTPCAQGARPHQGAKNMTKCAALWMPCANMSPVYRCLLCGSSPGSSAQAPRSGSSSSGSSRSGRNGAIAARDGGGCGSGSPGRTGIAGGRAGGLGISPPLPAGPGAARPRPPLRPAPPPARPVPAPRARAPVRPGPGPGWTPGWPVASVLVFLSSTPVRLSLSPVCPPSPHHHHPPSPRNPKFCTLSATGEHRAA